MANLIADFSSKVNNGVITLEDKSTAGYSGETITARKYIITFSDGTTEEIDAPIINGVGDETEYVTEKDYAFNIAIELTPSVVDPTSSYTKDYNILSASFTTDCLLKKRTDNILRVDPKNILNQSNNDIDDIEKVSSYYEAALTYMSINDLVAAQEAIDISYSLCSNCNCNC